MNKETWPRVDARSFLIVCLRYLGDVLVTTPLALSIKTAYPDAKVDYLVFKGSENVLAKNPCIANIITVSKNSNNLLALFSLYKKYDVAIATNVSDRAAIASAIAGKRSIGLTYGRAGELWKYFLFDMHQTYLDRLHVVSNMLSLTYQLGIPAIPRVVMGYDDDDIAFAQSVAPYKRYIVLHPYSQKSYKYWPTENWIRLAGLINEQTDCEPVFTRSPDPEGKHYLEQIIDTFRGIRAIDALCSLNQLAAIIKGSVAYVGIDTAITHVAASLEVPTIALYGPTWTRYWAPWPNNCGEQSPFAPNKGIQCKDYVTVVQRDWGCVPCNKETCAISTCGKIECMEQITPEIVFKEVIKNVSRHDQQ